MSLKDLYKQPVKKDEAKVLNEAGGAAFMNSPKHVFTKLLLTGMTGSTYYVDAKTTNDDLIALAKTVDPEFLAKALVYGRTKGKMRSNPIQLLVYLSTVRPDLFRKARRAVLRTGGDVLDFGTVVLSGSIREGWGSAPRKEIAEWFNTVDPYQIAKYGSERQNPSLKDLLRLTHPTPPDEERDQLFKWLADKKDKAGNQTWDASKLPEKIRVYLEFVELTKDDSEKARKRRVELLETGYLPHELVTAYKLSQSEWNVLAQKMPYFATLKNLNTMARHGVYDDKDAVKQIAAKLSNEEAVLKSNLFPYRFMSAYLASEGNLPQAIKTAIGTALEISTQNVPVIDGLVVVAPDVSGSMSGRINPQSVMRHIDVAALVTATILRKNKDAIVVPFDTSNHLWKGDANDTILTNAEKLARYGGGGTDVSLPFQYIREKGLEKDLALLVAITDNESWVGRSYGASASWKQIHDKNPDAKAMLINVAPYKTDQFREGTPGVTMISGFSDEVFNLMNLVASGDVSSQVAAIESLSLE